MAAAARDDKSVDREATLRAVLATMAPGTPLRDGLERILRGRTGGLLVLGHDRTVESLCTGGFALDVDFSATGVRELSKMDGAVILDRDATRILRANVQLVPDPTIPTEESGTRHRTAERVAKQTGFPVISVSQSMHIIALYVTGRRYVLEDSAAILPRANQALATLERYKMRLDEVTGTLSALEIEDLVTVRDVCAVAQRLEMVRRIAREIDGYVVELGADGRLLSLQLDELIAGVDGDRELVVRDYAPAGGRKQRQVPQILERPRRPRQQRAARPHGRGRGARPRRRPTRPSMPACHHAATGCLRRCRACPPSWSTGWSTTSVACSACSPPASTTCRPSTGSARAGRAPSGRGCRGSPSRASWSATSERSGARR